MAADATLPGSAAAPHDADTGLVRPTSQVSQRPTSQASACRPASRLSNQSSALSAPTTSTSKRWHIPAYYHNRTQSRAMLKPAASQIMWQQAPNQAADLHAVDLFQHQALPQRAGPHPVEGAMKRWPGDTYTTGGPAHHLDTRRHPTWFGYSQQRWKAPTTKGEIEVPQLTLEDVRLFLTKRFGSLKAAFDKLDFFQDGQLSNIEFQEGLYNLLLSCPGEDFATYRCPAAPRELFIERMQKLFQTMDVDGDGLISYNEFFGSYVQPGESQHKFTRRRLEERASAMGASERRKQQIMQRGVTTASYSEDTESAVRTSDILQLTRADASAPAEQRAAAAARTEEEAKVPNSSAGFPFGREPQAGASSSNALPSGTAAPTQLLHEFAIVMMKEYATNDKAFEAFDVMKNGQLSFSEFKAIASKLPFNGDLLEVFNELDSDGNGAISQGEFKILRQLPKMQAEAARLQATLASQKPGAATELLDDTKLSRSQIQPPAPHKRGKCLASTDIVRPLSERISSSAGFQVWGRTATGRMDKPRTEGHYYHPEHLPGVDAENFSPEHGPGFRPKGPGYHSEYGESPHPLRGNRCKLGATMNKTERFGQIAPSHQAKEDVGFSGSRYASYQGQAPNDTWRVSGTGSHSFTLKRDRSGPTFGTASSFGLQGPKPIGPWGDSRIGLHLKSTSTPSLLRKVA